jgi:hypothetical protein
VSSSIAARVPRLELLSSVQALSAVYAQRAAATELGVSFPAEGLFVCARAFAASRTTDASNREDAAFKFFMIAS